MPLRGILASSLLILVPMASLSCSDSGDGDGDSQNGGTPLPDSVSVVVDGLDRPTQITEGPDDTLVVAQLNGGEGAEAGQVLMVEPDTGDRRVLLDGLDKPTGVLWNDGALWVMQRRSLARATWSGQGEAGPLEVLLEDLPWNGRSEGTLTALGDGRIAYATTGSIRGGEVVPDSGVLWAFDPATETSEPLAVGAKNAYAVAELPGAEESAEMQLVVTEIGDNVTDPPDDELQILSVAPDTDPSDTEPPDAGWPDCPPPQECPGVVGPVAVFQAGSTPTGVAVEDDRAVVALFVTGELVEVDLRGWSAGDPPRDSTTVVDGLEGPHTVIPRGEDTVWVSEHGTGRILEVAL